MALLDVHVVGEAAREIEPLDPGGIDAERAHDDQLAAIVGGLGLAEIAGVFLREGDAVLRHYCHFHLLSVGGEDAFGGKHVAPSKLRQQVDQAGAAEAHWRCPANGLVEGLAIRAEADGLDGAVAGRHAVAHQSPPKQAPPGRRRRAGGPGA